MIRLLKKLPIFLMSVAIMAALIGLLPHSALAEPVVTTNAKDGLQISPVLVDTHTEKGKSYTVNVKITNVTTEDHTYYSIVNDFDAKDETGKPSVIFVGTLPDTASVRTWISTVSQITVKSGASANIVATINVPTNAEAGGHYGVLRFSSSPPKPESVGVSITASTGMLFLITVAGTINEDASVASFYTAPNSTDGQTSFFEKPPITFVTRIKNDGNVHLQPSGQILVHDMFGNLVSTIPLNNDKANVLPSSIRRFDTTLQSSWMFGHYTADLQLGYGTHGQALTDTIDFWVIPYKIVLVVLLVLISIILILVRLVKVYNRRIITRAIQKHENNKTNHSKK